MLYFESQSIAYRMGLELGKSDDFIGLHPVDANVGDRVSRSHEGPTRTMAQGDDPLLVRPISLVEMNRGAKRLFQISFTQN